MITLISLQTLKNEYLIDDNLDDKYILTIIKKGQDFIIKKLLWCKNDVNNKYDELITQISNNTLSNDNINLLNEIEPVLAWYICSEVMFSTAYKLKNLGMESGDSNRFNELIRISEKYKADSEAYRQILIEYCCNNNINMVDTNPYKSKIYFKHKSKYSGGYDYPKE